MEISGNPLRTQRTGTFCANTSAPGAVSIVMLLVLIFRLSFILLQDEQSGTRRTRLLRILQTQFSQDRPSMRRFAPCDGYSVPRSCRCRRQHAANHEKGFTTKRRRRGVSGAQDSMKSVERNANGHVSVQDTSTERIGYCQAKAAPNTASSTMGLSAKPNFCRFARDKKLFQNCY